MKKIIILILFTITTTAQARYDRKEWKHWLSTKCQNTRTVLLKTHSKTPVIFKDDKECTVLSGTWNDFYFDQTIFRANQTDIDHVIPLEHASNIGGESWSPEKKTQFANDPINLVITDKHYNRQKGAKTIAQWLPIQKEYACRYISRWLGVKHKYNLPLLGEEFQTIKISGCGINKDTLKLFGY